VLQHSLIDQPHWGLSGHDRKDRDYVRRSDPGKALICVAKRVRGQNHIVQRQDWIIDRRGFRIKDIQSGSSDLPGLKSARERGLIH